MFEFLNGLEDVLPYVKIAVVGIGVVLALIAAASFMYILQTSFRPLVVVMQWIVGYSPGDKPQEVILGFSYGARILVWAILIGLVGWVVFH